MRRKPTKKQIERAEFYSHAVLARQYIIQHIKEQGYIPSSPLITDLKAALAVINGLISRLETDEAKELIGREDTRFMAVIEGPDGELESIAIP